MIYFIFLISSSPPFSFNLYESKSKQKSDNPLLNINLVIIDGSNKLFSSISISISLYLFISLKVIYLYH